MSNIINLKGNTQQARWAADLLVGGKATHRISSTFDGHTHTITIREGDVTVAEKTSPTLIGMDDIHAWAREVTK